MIHNWTVMVYMAGDNGKVFDGGQLMADLQQYGWQNIAEMSKAGATSRVAIVVQYDTLDQQEYTPRLVIDGSSATGRLVETIPPVNTGDPKNLTEFIVWAMTSYPAEHYALILWNHGTGWKEDDIYSRYRDAAHRAIRGGEARAGGKGTRLVRRALFLPTVGEIMSIQDDDVRGICYDDTSMDFLDNHKLARALDDARAQTGRRLSVLGMDACLMSILEVAYQVRDCADYMVGSQEVEMARGWPYTEILESLVQTPSMSPRELSKVIVEEFGTHYLGVARDGGGINTQSAIDLRAVPQTFSKIKALSSLVADAYSLDFYTERAVLRARGRAQTFEDEDSLDLRHFMEILRDEYNGALRVRDLADDLVHHLSNATVDSPIVANFSGIRRPNANGLSIYFPSRGCSPFYEHQTFAESGWNKVICSANGL